MTTQKIYERIMAIPTRRRPFYKEEETTPEKQDVRDPDVFSATMTPYEINKNYLENIDSVLNK